MAHVSIAVHKAQSAFLETQNELIRKIPFLGTLYGKILVPIIGFMVFSMIITSIVFNMGIQKSTLGILDGQLRSENQKIITNLSGRLDTVDAAATMLAGNSEIIQAINSENEDALTILNSKALTVQNRFDLDLIQMYSKNGDARINLLQSSLNKVSSVREKFPDLKNGLVILDNHLVYLSQKNISGGGEVFIGIDLNSELERIAFNLGLSHTPVLVDSFPANGDHIYKNGEYILFSSFAIQGQEIYYELNEKIQQVETITNSGRLLIMISSVIATLALLILLAIVLNGIIKPIHNLAANAEKISHADFSTLNFQELPQMASDNLLHIGQNDEIGVLNNAFIKMTGELNYIYQGLIKELRQTNEELNVAYDSALQGWSSALELRDHDTERHTERTTEQTISLAKFIGIPDSEIIHYKRGALLHDVGKMAIPDEILRKPGPLTDKEWEIMRQHPLYAYVMLRKVPYLEKSLDIPYCHHEKWNGTGYPRGLFQKEIPLSARIFSIIDVYDSMRNDRPYRKGLPEFEVRQYIRSRSGIDFDPEIVEYFFKWLEHKEREKWVL
jgi:HD-GYP domain-containing protein (c-di-GMP phosphodiesterase class II)